MRLAARRLTPVTAVALAALAQACGSHATNPYYSARSPVEIVDQEPAPGATGVPERTKVEVEFGQEIDPATLDPSGGPPFTCGGSSGFLVCDALGNAVKGTIAYSDRLAVFTAGSALTASTTYEVLIKGVQDTRGLPLATSGTSWSFTVRPLPPLPALIARVPLDRTAVPVNLTVRLELDQPIDPSSLSAASILHDTTPTGTALGGITSWDPVGNAIVFTPNGVASANTDYYAVVPNGLRDTLGRPLAAFAPLHFKTGNVTDVTRPTLTGAPAATESPSGSGNVVLHLPAAGDAANEWMPQEIRFEATVSKNRLSGPTCADPFDPQTFHLAAIGSSGDVAIVPPATIAAPGNLLLAGLDNGVWSFQITARDGSGRDSLPSSTGTVIVRAGGVTFTSGLKPTFAKRCALADCHSGASPPGVVQLDDAAQFVGTGHRSPDFQNLPYVTPFCLEQSYVWRKIVPGYAIAGGLMPPEQDDLQQLSRPQIHEIEEWILQGAN